MVDYWLHLSDSQAWLSSRSLCSFLHAAQYFDANRLKDPEIRSRIAHAKYFYATVRDYAYSFYGCISLEVTAIHFIKNFPKPLVTKTKVQVKKKLKLKHH